jgi:DNA-directed RNA polymerase subunit beta'
VREVAVPAGYEILVSDEDRVQEDTLVARTEGNGDGPLELAAGMEGKVVVDHNDDGTAIVRVRREDKDVHEYPIPANARLRVEPGAEVRAGTQLTEGAKNPKEILRIQGREEAQLYLLEQVQQVYRSQGVAIHDKHIEVVLRQLLRRVLVRATGDTDLLPGELIDRFRFEDINNEAIAKGGKPSRAEPIVLGLTKAALNTESFLAAASFQETTRVLTEAAIKGQKDDLRGLKENVIIGKLIPVGTGFMARRQKALEDEQRRLLAEHVDTEAGEIELEMTEMDLQDLDLSELTGVSELGMEPLGVKAAPVSDDDGDDDLDLESLDEEEESSDDNEIDSDSDSDSDLDIDVDMD